MIALSRGQASPKCCGDDSNEYWIAYDSSENTLGVCCDGTWHEGGNVVVI